MAAAASGGGGAAPFVWKTYRMVEDPGTDGVIGWGKGNNSFVVADPFVFSQTMLPAHFKHNNFSSFVRQLNTYGFRKVDPDRWEFAHGSFLRGQTHLLRNIVRRGTAVGAGKRKDAAAVAAADLADDDLTMVATEVVRLKKEQSTIDDRVAAMWRRVQETERKPKQMLAFLLTIVGDRDTLQRLVDSGSNGLAADQQQPVVEGGEKRARLLLDGGDFGNVTAFGPDAVDFAGFYADGDAFANVAMPVEAAARSGGGAGAGCSFAFGDGTRRLCNYPCTGPLSPRFDGASAEPLLWGTVMMEICVLCKSTKAISWDLFGCCLYRRASCSNAACIGGLQVELDWNNNSAKELNWAQVRIRLFDFSFFDCSLN